MAARYPRFLSVWQNHVFYSLFILSQATVWSSCFVSSRSFPVEFFRCLPALPFMWDCKGGCDRLVCSSINMVLIFILHLPFMKHRWSGFLDDQRVTEIGFWIRALLAETYPDWCRWHRLSRGKREGRNLFLQEGVATVICQDVIVG